MLRPLEVFVSSESLIEDGGCEAGDLLEIDRKLYSHWAVYIGNSEVVQLPDTAGGKAIVERCTIHAVTQDDPVRVNNKQVTARDKELTAFPNDEVVQRAIDCVGTAIPYNIVTSNGEHFVTKLKYGVSWSDQAEVMRNSVSSLSQTPSTPKEMLRVHADLFTEIQNILSSSPPVNCTLSPPIQSISPLHQHSLSSISPSPPPLADENSSDFPLSQNSTPSLSTNSPPAFPSLSEMAIL